LVGDSLNRIDFEEKLRVKKERLDIYYQREKEMLSQDGVKSYGIGSRNITRYDTALKEIQTEIKKLENEIDILNGQLSGRSPRKSVGIIPRDW
jgi:wobble nucleotide-excising tRNase